jgi:hypothetical protein
LSISTRHGGLTRPWLVRSVACNTPFSFFGRSILCQVFCHLREAAPARVGPDRVVRSRNGESSRYLPGIGLVLSGISVRCN